MDSTFKKPLDPTKFRDPDWTTNGERRARVALGKLETLWFNTGTLCNLTCGNCYIESSPSNDRLVYLSRQEVAGYLDEVEREGLGTGLVGFTGGEPFMNREIVAILDETLGRGYQVLVLTNAMRPMMKLADELLDLRRRFGERLTIRVSLDHHTKSLHEAERGPRSWKPALEGLAWLARNGFALNVAGRLFSGESENGCQPRRARDYGGLLGHPGRFAGGRHVCVLAHGGQTQGGRASGRLGLHLVALRPRVRTGPGPERGG
jgi:uncharacterized Fe-S cluster-containing radical SAM superfamily protein